MYACLLRTYLESATSQSSLGDARCRWQLSHVSIRPRGDRSFRTSARCHHRNEVSSAFRRLVAIGRVTIPEAPCRLARRETQPERRWPPEPLGFWACLVSRVASMPSQKSGPEPRGSPEQEPRRPPLARRRRVLISRKRPGLARNSFLALFSGLRPAGASNCGKGREQTLCRFMRSSFDPLAALRLGIRLTLEIAGNI